MRPSVLLLIPEVRQSRRGVATACGLAVAGALRHRLNVAVFGLRARHGNLRTVMGGEIGITAGAVFVFGVQM